MTQCIGGIYCWHEGHCDLRIWISSFCLQQRIHRTKRYRHLQRIASEWRIWRLKVKRVFMPLIWS